MDYYHPRHGCLHGPIRKSVTLRVWWLLPEKVQHRLRRLIRFKSPKTNVRLLSGTSHTVPDQNLTYTFGIENIEITDVYHPTHGCHHPNTNEKLINPLATLYENTNYKKRQILKKFTPEFLWKTIKKLAQR